MSGGYDDRKVLKYATSPIVEKIYSLKSKISLPQSRFPLNDGLQVLRRLNNGHPAPQWSPIQTEWLMLYGGQCSSPYHPVGTGSKAYIASISKFREPCS